MVIFTPVLSEDDYKAAQKKIFPAISARKYPKLCRKNWFLLTKQYLWQQKTTFRIMS